MNIIDFENINVGYDEKIILKNSLNILKTYQIMNGD